jgi:DNA-binding XRE family transcriptional regulator
MSETGTHPLKLARDDLDFTQEDLAVATGLSTKTIKRAEQGEPLDQYTISRICDYFSEHYHRRIDQKELGLRKRHRKNGEDGRKEAPEAVQVAKRQLSNLEKIDDDTAFSPEILHVGGLAINLIILARGRYGPKEMHCFYDGTTIQLPPEFESMKKALMSDLEMKKANGETKLPYNSETYKLKEFSTGYREIIDGKEVPVLRLKFGPTDYFTQMVTDLNVGNPIRERYAKAACITEHPVPEFATLLGINLNFITKDGYLILTERSSQAFVAGGRLHTSVGENLLRPLDARQSGAPDPFRCALRGAQEELGVTLHDEDVVFSTFTVIPDSCQYSLISTIQIQRTRAEIEDLWRFAIPSDKWESRRLLFYPHHPDSIAQFAVSTWDRWFNVALAAVVLSLLDIGYSKEQIDTAFLHVESRLSR